MTDFQNKRVMITGAARGIGAAIAMELAERGADICFTFITSNDAAADLVSKIEALGRRAFAIKADSADPAAIRGAVDQAAKLLGGLDILVNNAGVLFMGPVEEMKLEHIDKILAVNIRGVVLASQAAIPHLKAGGRIITIGSCLAERVAFENVAIYSMSKSALLSFTRGLARELGPRGITVNLVHPGPTETEMSPPDAPGAAAMRAQIALGRYGTDRDVATAVAFIAGPSGRHITGTGLNVDGGMNA